jgi:hypothetical protein
LPTTRLLTGGLGYWIVWHPSKGWLNLGTATVITVATVILVIIVASRRRGRIDAVQDRL